MGAVMEPIRNLYRTTNLFPVKFNRVYQFMHSPE